MKRLIKANRTISIIESDYNQLIDQLVDFDSSFGWDDEYALALEESNNNSIDALGLAIEKTIQELYRVTDDINGEISDGEYSFYQEKLEAMKRLSEDFECL